MSLSLCTDALVLELLPAERIASITYLSRNPGNSFQWPLAATLPINHGNAEEVFAQKPDLVFAGTFTTPAARRLIKAVGIPLMEVPPSESFEDIRSTLRSVARALGRSDVAERLIEMMDAKLRALDATRPARIIRVASWDGSGSVPGRGTLFDAILRAAGGVNIAAVDGRRSGSFDIEQLLSAHPDVLAYGSDSVTTPSLQTAAAQHPTLLKLYAGRRVSYPSVLYSCGVVESADAAAALRAGLLAVMRQGE
jgi:iron complex transport system substrate-binding protein